MASSWVEGTAREPPTESKGHAARSWAVFPSHGARIPAMARGCLQPAAAVLAGPLAMSVAQMGLQGQAQRTLCWVTEISSE